MSSGRALSGGILICTTLSRIVQVFPELAPLDRRVERTVRRGDYSYVGTHALGASDPQEFPGLDDAKKADLHAERHLADLVQEKSSAVRALEKPLPLRHRARERSSLVPEELAFENTLRERAAIHRLEEPLAAFAREMYRASRKLLAGSALSLDENAHFRRRHPEHRFEHLVYLARSPDEFHRALDPADRHGLRERRGKFILPHGNGAGSDRPRENAPG